MVYYFREDRIEFMSELALTLSLSLSLCLSVRLLRQVFAMYDTDRKGQLSMQEVTLGLHVL